MKRLLARSVNLLIAGVVVGTISVGSFAQDAPNADLFGKLDTNADGVLTADEIPEEQKRYFERVLRVGDKNEDGKITKDEFAAALANDPPRETAPGDRPREGFGRGFTGERPDPAQMLSRMDRNQDGKISKDELPEFMRERVGKLFDQAGKEALTPEEFGKLMAEQGFGRPGAPGGPGGPPGGPEFLRQFDKNNDGKISKDELPEGARERMAPLFERLGTDEISLERLAEMGRSRDREQLAQRPDGQRPDGERPPQEGDRPPGDREGARPRDGERPPMPRDGERPPREGDRPPGDRDGARPPMPRDGERPPMGRDGEMRPPFGGPGRGPAFLRLLDQDQNGRISKAEMLEVGRIFAELDRNRDNELDMSELMGFGPGEGPGPGPRDGERPPMGRDGDRPPMPRDGERPPREGDRPPMARDGERPPMPRDGERPPMPRDGERPPMGPGGQFGAEAMFRNMDRNGDGFIDREEAPERLRENFADFDVNQDGKLSADELREGFARRFGGGRPPGGRPDGGRPDGERPPGSDRPERPRRPE